MADYDFHKLNPLDFERMCCELLHVKEGLSYHTFREGRDGGIDILRADDLSDAIVYQCKRYADRDLMLSKLRNDELPKVRRLNPSKYGLMTSLKLTPQDKQQIKDEFNPYIKSLEDIIDGCDLNALLECEEARTIVSHYPALWLPGIHVLTRTINNDIVGRSEFFVRDSIAEVRNCVWTDAMSSAQRRLENEHVVVLTGDPGIGKTVTAKMLLLDAINRGYEPVVTFDKIGDLEQLYFAGQKQIFFFDDFLGHQVLEAALMLNDRGICSLIRRIQEDPLKLFILTSRTTIINQGVYNSGSFKNLWRKPPSCMYRVEGYSNFDRARILAAHMSSSALPRSSVAQLFENRDYWKIIEHRNFNPRIIELVMSNTAFCTIHHEDRLVAVFSKLLDSPQDIWKELFEQTLTADERMIVWTVFLIPTIDDARLHGAFSKFLLLNKRSTVTDASYEKSIEVLSDSILSRRIDYSGKVTYDLRNPSVGDFLLSQMQKDATWIIDVLPAVGDYRAVDKLRDFREKMPRIHKMMGDALLVVEAAIEFSDNPELKIAVWREMIDLGVVNAARRIVKAIKSSDMETVDIGNCDCLISVLWALDGLGVNLMADTGLTFLPDIVDRWIQGCEKFDSVAHMYSLLHKYGVELPPNMGTCLNDCLRQRAWDIAGELPEPEFETDEYGQQHIAEGEEDWLCDEIEDGIKKLLAEFQIPESMIDARDCARDPDLDEIFRPPSEQYNYGESHRDNPGEQQEKMVIDGMFDSLRDSEYSNMNYGDKELSTKSCSGV